MAIGMQALTDVSGFDPGRVAAPWHDLTTWSTWEEAVGWALQAMKITSDRLRAEVGDGSVNWNEFYQQLDTTFQNSNAWSWHPILQRLLKAARERESDSPLRIDDDLWVEIGLETQRFIDGWYTDTADLRLLAADLNVDPVACGWVTDDTAQHSERAPASEYDQPVPDFARDFANFLQWHVDREGTLPDIATVGGWFGRSLRPETVVSRCHVAFPNGLTTPSGVLSLDQIGSFYLGSDTWARTASWYSEQEQSPKPGDTTRDRTEPDFNRDFAQYVERHVRNEGLPELETVRGWFGQQLWPEAVVARFREDFPQGVKTAKGAYSLDDIGAFYLGQEQWAATEALQDEQIDPEFVQEILNYFSDDTELTTDQLERVRQAIDDGLITIEDDDE